MDSMAHTTPQEIAEFLLKEMTREQALRYAEKIAQMNVTLSPDYQQAKEIIEAMK